MTARTALLQGLKLLEDAEVGVPRLTAEVLLAHALHRDRVYLFSHPEHELAELVNGSITACYLHARHAGQAHSSTSPAIRSFMGASFASRRTC